MKIIPLPRAAGQRDDLPRPVVRLPVAAKALARVRWAADAKTQPAMTPEAAVAWLGQIQRHGGAIASVECAGPGEPLATPGILFETLALIRRHYPELALEVVTLGLGGEEHARQLAALGVHRVTMLVDAVEPEAAAKVYAWVRPGTRTIPLPQAVELLVEEQTRAIAAFTQAGMTVHIEITLCPGINDGEVEAVARKMAALGAASMTMLLARQAADAPLGDEAEEAAMLARARSLAARHLPLVEARGITEPGGTAVSAPGGVPLPKPTPERPNVAVVSISGMEVDLHLGHAIKALVYGPRQDGLISLIASRDLPEPGGGAARWQEMARILHDCFALLTVSAGESPKKALADHGIRVLITEGEIDGAVDLLYGSGKKGKGGRSKRP